MAKKPKEPIVGAPYPKGWKPMEPIEPPPGCWDEIFVPKRKYVECPLCGGLASFLPASTHSIHRSEDGVRIVNCLGKTVALFMQKKKP